MNSEKFLKQGQLRHGVTVPPQSRDNHLPVPTSLDSLHTNKHMDLHPRPPLELVSRLRDYLWHHSTCILSPSFFCLVSSLTQSPLSCCWSQSRAVWGGSVGCGSGLWCRGAGSAPARYTEASCARRSSYGPPSQSRPSPSAPAPLYAQPRWCWNCTPLGGPLSRSCGQ